VDQTSNARKADEQPLNESENNSKKRKRDEVEEGDNPENDPEFEEFLTVANKKTKFWANDDSMTTSTY